ncbi:CTCF protein, partial [Pitta sordida]|nr:CTCF protein [Pitta sordida]
FNSDSSSRLRHHLKSHPDEIRYMCHLCPKAFHTATLLHNHVNTHTGTKPYKCSECDTAFVTRGELSRHRRYRHTLEKPFKCTACEYCSVEVSTALLNLLGGSVHFHMEFAFLSNNTYYFNIFLIGEKRYECCVCQARFTQRGTMKIHMLQKHGENVSKHQCPHCSIFISRKGDLGVRLKNFHSYVEEATECSACKAVFHERYTFLQHKKTHRGGKRFKRAQCGYTCNK